MNRNYSRDGLLKMYQEEANDHREKRLMEKQARILEERKAMDSLNREIEQENQAKQNSRMQRMNERMEEYNKMLEKKQVDKENRGGKRSDKSITNGTFKIGGENREIKKKNYDEIGNSLVLNPMKEYPVRGRSEMMGQPQLNQRGNSHGFNIINHSLNENSQNANRTNYGRTNNITNYKNENQEKDGGKYNIFNVNVPNQNNNYQSNFSSQNVNNYNNQMTQQNQINQNAQLSQNYQGMGTKNAYNNYETNNQPIDNIDNLEDFPYRDEYIRDQEQKAQPQNPPEYDEAEFQKYYEEYLRKKLQEEEMGAAVERQMQQNEMPTTMKEYEAYKTQQQQNFPENYGRGYGMNMNEVENQMNKLNIQNEQEKEYMNNKMKNQYGYGYNHIAQRPENYYSNPVGKEVEINPGSKKVEQQENYRNYLQTQIQEKNNIKNSQNEYPNNNRVRISKKDSIPLNPYSTKNYDFGGSNLSSNPITNPVNSYQFNYNKFRQPMVPSNNSTRQIGSARMRDIGNNIMK